MCHGHGEKLTRKKEAVIAALLTEPTQIAAAKKAGISPATLKRYRKNPDFEAEYQKAKSQLVPAAVDRLHKSMAPAVDTLVATMTNGTKDADRLRAAIAVLQQGFRGFELADALQPPTPVPDTPAPRGINDLIELLADQIRRVSQSRLGTEKKALLLSKLATDLAKVNEVGLLQQRIEALESVVSKRKEARR